VALKPLNLHERIDKLPEEEWAKSLSQVTITGRFSAQDALIWVSNCLPDVP